LKPPIAITPEQVILPYRKDEGWITGGDRHGPLPYFMKNFYNMIKNLDN
jgi:hypothetical protein